MSEALYRIDPEYLKHSLTQMLLLSKYAGFGRNDYMSMSIIERNILLKQLSKIYGKKDGDS